MEFMIIYRLNDFFWLIENLTTIESGKKQNVLKESIHLVFLVWRQCFLLNLLGIVNLIVASFIGSL